MPSAAGPLLERHRIFSSQDAEETRAFLRGKDYRLELPRRQAGQLDARLNAFYMPGMYLGYLRYGSLPIELSPGPARSDYLLQLPVRGNLAARVAGESINCDHNRAAVISPVREKCRFLSNAGSARIQLSISQAAMVRQLTTLLGNIPAAPLDFTPAMDLAAGYGRSLAQYVLMAAADLDHPDSVLLNPVTMERFEEFIMTGLLLSHPHTFSESLRRLERSVAPRDVKRAVDFMEDSLDAPVKMADLVAITGVPGRTLLQHFKHSKGVSPIRYLRNARFRKVREALISADTGESVTAIATRWGFAHLGRFSVEYRARFGERPSETLRRRATTH